MHVSVFKALHRERVCTLRLESTSPENKLIDGPGVNKTEDWRLAHLGRGIDSEREIIAITG